MKVVCFGPGPVFKGGLSNYNTALAKALHALPSVEVKIVSWTQQYPSIIPREFKDKDSKLDFLEGTDIHVEYITNYNLPWTWRHTADKIIDWKPDIVVFQWAIAIQGIPLSRIAKRIQKRSPIEVLFDLHFVIQKEHSFIDKKLTKIALKYADNFIVHAQKTIDELRDLFPHKDFHVTETGERTTRTTIIKLYHPIYSLFEPDKNFALQEFKKEHGLKRHVFLFFGFIRKYKGLHHAIQAFHIVQQKRDDVSLLICGESFWKTLDDSKLSTKIKSTLFRIAKGAFLKQSDDEGDYRPLELIKQLGIEKNVVVFNHFIANEDVHKFFQVSDTVILFYEYATPSGIESLSYNFQKPLLATRVGHFEETIEDGFNGYLAEAENVEDMARVMVKYLEHPLPPENVVTKTKHMSWENYARTIVNTKSLG